MRAWSLIAMAGLLVVANVALVQPTDAASPPHKAPTASSSSVEAPPLQRLPAWAVPRSYKLALRSDPDEAGYSGTVTIALDLKRPSDHLWLHGKSLKVSSVTITDATGHARAGKYDEVAPTVGVARIEFGSTLPSQEVTLKITFSASYNQALQGYYKVLFADNAYAMTQMELISARLAFPCFDEPGIKVPLTLSLTIPNADKAVATTAQASDRPSGKGWKTVTFFPTKPLPTYLYAWAVGPWDIVDGPTVPPDRWRSTPVPVRGIATKGNGPKMRRALAMVPDILVHEEAYYGFGYPFGKIDFAALPDFQFGAMENPGLVTFRDWLLLLGEHPTPAAIRQTFNDEAHELAHQWTGDTVTPDWFNHFWLNEAFAVWMQQKIEGQIHPEWHAHLDRIEGAEGAMRDLSSSSAWKGAAVIGMFENFVGAKVFQDGMRAYIGAHAFGTVDGNDLVNAIATAAGRGAVFVHSFLSFFNQNVAPQLTTKLDCKHKSGALLELAQSRYLPFGSTDDSNREWGIPVCVRFPHGVQCQLLNTKTGVMRVDGGQCPAWYMPNADGNGYYRYAMAKPDRAALANVITRLNAPEQLTYADSTDAAFHRGDLDAGEALAAMQQLAPSKMRRVALAPLNTVSWIYDHEAQTSAQRATIRNAVAKAYLPRLEALGYQRRADESADAVLMRSALAGALGLKFEVPSVRAPLLKQGEAALKPGADGLPDLAAANPDLLRDALAVAVEAQGKPAVDELMAAIPKITDPFKRNAMLGALSHAQGAEANVARNFALSTNVKVSEMAMVLSGYHDTVVRRDDLWTWFVHHYAQVVARTGIFSGGNLPGLAAGGSCSRAEAMRVDAYFKPRLGQMSGLKQGLAQTDESILLCSALKARQNPVSSAR